MARNGQPLRGSSRQRYVQATRGRTESAHVDDPSVYLELAVAASEAVPLNRDAYYALARGRADGARRTLAERRHEDRVPTPGDEEMPPAQDDRVTRGTLRTRHSRLRLGRDEHLPHPPAALAPDRRGRARRRRLTPAVPAGAVTTRTITVKVVPPGLDQRNATLDLVRGLRRLRHRTRRSA